MLKQREYVNFTMKNIKKRQEEISEKIRQDEETKTKLNSQLEEEKQIVTENNQEIICLKNEMKKITGNENTTKEKLKIEVIVI